MIFRQVCIAFKKLYEKAKMHNVKMIDKYVDHQILLILSLVFSVSRKIKSPLAQKRGSPSRLLAERVKN